MHVPDLAQKAFLQGPKKAILLAGKLQDCRHAVQVPSADALPRIDSIEAVTAGSRATADIHEPPPFPIVAADKGSQVLYNPSLYSYQQLQAHTTS